MVNRHAGLDLLRVMGLGAVVAGHVFDGDIAHRALYTWHVPLFLFLSGYFWHSKPGPRRQVFIGELRVRARSLLVPYVAWLLLILLLTAIASQVLRADGAQRIVPTLPDLARGGSSLGGPFLTFWFVTVLATCALAFRLLEHLPAPALAAVALGGIAVTQAAPDAVTSVPLAAGLAWPLLFFVMTGRAFRAILPRIRRRLPLALLLGAVGVGAVVYGSKPLDLKQGDLGTPVSSVVVALALCCSLTLVFDAIGPRLPVRTGAIATRLALGGMAVLLGHGVVLWAARGVYDNDLVVFAAALVLPWTVAMIVLRTRASRLLLGVTPR